MRHTFASLLAINGVWLFKIAKWMGDTLATTEKHYAHLAPQDHANEMLSNQRIRNGTRLTQEEMQILQGKVERYETALRELVPAKKLHAYWAELKRQKTAPPKAERSEDSELRIAQEN